MKSLWCKQKNGYLFAGLSVIFDISKLAFGASMGVVIISLIFIGAIFWMYHINMAIGGRLEGRERWALKIILGSLMAAQMFSLFVYANNWQDNSIVIFPYIIIFLTLVFVLFPPWAKRG